MGLVDGTRDGSSKLTENTLHVVAPVIDSVVVDENASVSGNVLANDRVGLSPADVLTVTGWVLNGITYAPEAVIALPNAEGATITLHADGSYVVDALNADALSANNHLNFTLAYTILQTNDTGMATGSSTLTILVNGKNDAPIAHDDAISIDLRDGNTYDALLLLGNDSDVDRGDHKTIVSLNGLPPGVTYNALTHQVSVDPDVGTTWTYSIAGGSDAAKFGISAGKLVFLSAPNFEAPTDVGANNIYDVTIRVSDGALSVTKNVHITVTDVVENHAPIAVADNLGSVTESSAANPPPITLSNNIMANDSDPDGDPFHIHAFNGVIDGSSGDLSSTAGLIKIACDDGQGWILFNLSLNTTTGQLIYNEGPALADSYSQGSRLSINPTYTLIDNHGNISEPANLFLQVNGIGNPPPPPLFHAADDSYIIF